MIQNNDHTQKYKKKFNFHDAFYRHEKDANFLFENYCLENADHLYGLAAECAIKYLLSKKCIIKLNKKGDISTEYKEYRCHINKLWELYNIVESTRDNYKTNDNINDNIKNKNPFRDWNIDQRYAPNDYTTWQTVDNHRKAVESLKEILKRPNSYYI